MQPNEKIICPKCGEPSIAKLKARFDGFQAKGNVLCCMLCGAELEVAADRLPESSSAENNGKKLNDLSVLLGATPVATARLAAADDEKRFCKDCAHFLKHPFVDRCDLDNHPVEVMDDCEKFTPRK